MSSKTPGTTSPEDHDAPGPQEDVAADIRHLFEEAHAAGLGSDPEALPELPPEASVSPPADPPACMMVDAVERYVDALEEWAEHLRQGNRTH